MSETIVKGKPAVAAHFGVSERQVRRWVKDPSFPSLSGRRYDLIQIQAWRDRKDGQAPARAALSGDPRQPELSAERGKDYEDSRLKRTRRELLELDLRQRRGDLIPRKEVGQLFVARIMAVKQGLLVLARALPLQLATCRHEREMEPIITRAVRNLLETFSRPLPESLGGPGPGPEMADVADSAFIDDLKETPGPGNQRDKW